MLNIGQRRGKEQATNRLSGCGGGVLLGNLELFSEGSLSDKRIARHISGLITQQPGGECRLYLFEEPDRPVELALHLVGICKNKLESATDPRKRSKDE
jgi:hypothetical protein